MMGFKRSNPARVWRPRGSAVLMTGVLAGLYAGLTSCSTDPYLETQIAVLGPEDPAVPVGEYHRPGQPCTRCHNDVGTAKPQFSVAGTIYPFPEARAGVADIEVRLIDSEGDTRVVRTNCAGNFFIGKDVDLESDAERVPSWNPAFPLRVALSFDGKAGPAMNSYVNRDGSCGGCHFAPNKLDYVDVVYFSPTQNGAPTQDPKCDVP